MRTFGAACLAVALVCGAAAAQEPAATQQESSPSDPRTWRAALGTEARQRHELRPGVELFFSSAAPERLVAMLRLAGAAAADGVTFEVPGAEGFAPSPEGHARLSLPGGDLAFVRPGAVEDDGAGRQPVFVSWSEAGPGAIKLSFPGHSGKLPLLVRFEVIFLADPAALERYDRNRDGRVDIKELVPAAEVQPEAPEGGPAVSASLVDALLVDNGTPGQANPNDVIGYTATIDSTGTSATALDYDNPIDPDTTLLPGSLNVSPLALDDTYGAVGNVTLDVDSAPAGIFGNDREFPFGPSAFTLATAGPDVGTQTACGSFPCLVTTAQGGTVTLKAPGDGRFTYSSPSALAIPGTDSFVYVITDGALTGTGTVTFNIDGRVWFVDRDAAGGGTGTQASPFNLLATVNGAGGVGDPDGPNDIIYLHDRAAATDYTGGVELEAGQRLVGSGVPLIVSGSTVLPATTPPVVEHPGGNAITLIAGIVLDGRPHVEGLNVNAAANAAIAGTGVSGAFTIDQVAINTSGTGAGLSLTNYATGTLTFNGSIGGSGTGAAVALSGGAGSLALGGATINKTAGRLVDVQNKTGGVVNVGALSGTGAATDAIVVQNNTGAAVNFNSGFSVTTSAGRGLFASNGGTVTVGGTASISATGGAALDVSNTSLGGGATLASASSTGSPAEGLRLVGVSGPLNIGGGAISGSTGTAFSLAQGSGDVTYAGSITKTSAGRAVDVQTRAGGVATFSGGVTATGASTGINVSGATAASSVSFTGAVDLGSSGTRLTGGTALTVNHGGNASTTSFSDLDVFTTGEDGISASNGGTLNVTTGQVDAGGRALNLDGLALGATLTSVLSSGSTAEGVRVNNVSGSLSVGSTSVTGPNTQGILVQGSSATVNFAASGATSVSGTGTQRILVSTTTGNVTFGNTTLSGGTDGVSLQNNSGGTRSFGTLMVGGNSGVGFLHAVGGGTTSVTGATIITNPGGTGVAIQGSASAVTFNGVTVNKGASAGTGVSLASNTTSPSFGVLAVTASNGTGVLVSSSGLTTSGGSIAATNGPAINSSAGAFAASFASVSSTNSGTEGLTLTGSSGTLGMSGGSVSGSAGTAFSVSGGNAAVSYAGTVTVTNGQSGLVTNNVTGGSLALAAVGVAGTGAGRDAVVIDGTGNAYDVTITSATLNTNSMRHGVALSDLGAGSDITISGGAITSTGAGRRVVNFAGPTNGVFNFSNVTLSASGSDGLNFASTQSGTYSFRDLNCGTPNGGVCVTGNGNSAAASFRSVAQSNGSRGISLTGTTGSFSISGDGGGSNNGSGGVIQNTSAEGVLLNGAANVSLGYMDIDNSGSDSIRITNINGFTLNRSNISDSAGTTSDKAIDIGDFSTGTPVNGSINITNSVIGPAAGSSPHDSLAAGISGGTSTWAVTNTTFRNTGNSGINLELRGSTVVTGFNVNNCTFAGAGFATSARAVFANNLDDSVMTMLTVQNSIFTNNNIHTDFNQQNDTDPVGSSEFAMLNNTTMMGARSHAMNIFAAAGTFAGTFEGTTSGNVIGNSAVAESGSAIGNGIRVNVNGDSDVTQLLNGNTIRQTPNGRGIEIIGRNGTGGLDITVTNNNVNPQALANPLAAILVQSNCLTVCNTVRSDVRLNTVPPATDVTDLLNTYIQLVESSTSTSELVDSTAPISGTCASELAATNTGSTGVLGGCALIAGPIATP